MPKLNFYAVRIGKNPGIFTEWYGKNGALKEVYGHSGAKYKGFVTRKEAEEFMNATDKPNALQRKKKDFKSITPKSGFYDGEAPPWD